MKLVLYPDPILKTVIEERQVPISSCSNDWKRNKPKSYKQAVVEHMQKIMLENGGVGLAAPQIGFKARMFIWMHGKYIQSIWNPKLINLSGNIISTEGCLSLPGIVVNKNRHVSSVLEGVGINGRPLSFIGNAKFTPIWQHEIDHLDGKLIIDDMSNEDSNKNRDAILSMELNSSK